jgi:RNA polymerase sigma-B factor
MTVASSSVRNRSLELLLKYQQEPSIALRNQLVRLNAGLVRKIAHRISHQSTEPYEDLEQIGHLGLIRAIERFDPSQGCAFSSFAVPYIRGEMLHFLRDRSSNVKLPRRWQEIEKEGQKVRDALTASLGRPCKENEVAEKLDISLNEWHYIKAMVKYRSPVSLDATIHQQDSTMTLADVIPDVKYQAFQHWEDERQMLQQALSQLEETTRTAIESVFFADLSRREVAEQMGVSPMTIGRRVQKGLEQLLTILQPQTP